MSTFKFCLLGLAQLIANGTIYYAFTVLVTPISDGLGHPVSWSFGCLTIALLIGGLTSPYIGKYIDRHGGKGVLILGSMLGSMAFSALCFVQGLASLTLVLILLQVAGVMALYEALFPVLVQADESRAPKLITGIMLFAGFSSSVFWPLTQWLLAHTDYRNICAFYAALNFFVCVPVYMYVFSGVGPKSTHQVVRVMEAPVVSAPINSALIDRRMLWMTLSFCLSSFSYNAINLALIPALTGIGASAASVASFSVLIGPSMVAARFLQFLGGEKLHPLMIGKLTTIALVLCMALVTLVPTASSLVLVLFMVLFGISQGLISIVRGTLPLALFGSEGYGERLGKMNALRRFFIAAAPFVFGSMIEFWGSRWAFGITATFMVVAVWLLYKIKMPDAGGKVS